jgi:hypothetical protein
MKALLLFFTLLSSFSLNADELDEAMSGFDEPIEDELGDLDESGFDDLEIVVQKPLENKALESHKEDWYRISGYGALQFSYNYMQASESTVAPGDMPMDFSGLSSLKFKAGLTLDMKHSKNWRSKIEAIAWYDSAWAIKGKSGYTDDVLDRYEYFLDIKDAYIQGSLTKNLDIKVGRQKVIWGKSDSIRVTDIINPLDNRSPGMVDIEDQRLSELMTRLDYYFGDWGLSGIIIHEPRLEIEPAFGSDYRPSDTFGTPIPYAKFPEREKHNWSGENMQYALSLGGHFTGWDMSYYFARVFDNRFGVQYSGVGAIRTVDLINMVGTAGNVVIGSWLLKGELALITDINYRSTGRKNRLDALIGVDYMGIKDTVISLEFANRHIFNYEDKMLTMSIEEAVAQNVFPDFVREDSMQMAFRSSYSFDHDNAQINYLLSLAFGNGVGSGFDGGFQRLWLDYKATDALSLNAGVVHYIAGSSLIPFYQAIKDNGRVFSEIKYSF